MKEGRFKKCVCVCVCTLARARFKIAPRRVSGGRRLGFHPWVGKIPWRRAWQPTPVFLPGKYRGQWTLAGYSPWGPKESDTTKRLSTQEQTITEDDCQVSQTM